MKRVLIFSTAYLPLIGGAEVAVKEITDRLGDDFVFDLICARIEKNLPAREQVGQVNVYRMGGGWGRLDKFLLPWRGARLAQKLHQKKNYDLTWAIMASFGGLAALFFKNKNPQVPYLLTLQEGDSPEHIRSRARWLGPYYKKMFTRTDFITVISRYLKNFALGWGAKSQIEVIPNGVDLSIFLKEGNGEEVLNNKLNKGGNDKFIIHTGRLTKKNALDDIIRALQYLPDNYKFLSLGDGPDLSDLKQLAAKEGVAERVIFFGQVGHEQMLKCLKVADVFVRPSLSEGLGNSFLEAMAAGLPVIGTSVGGIPDFLTAGETGLFCEVKNPKSIADQIKLLFSDEALRQKLIVNAKKLVGEKYGWDKIARQMADIFVRLIKS